MQHRHELRGHPSQKKSHPLPDGLFSSANTGGWSAIEPQIAHKKKKGLRPFDLKPLISMAGPMGLEPTASGVTGR